MTNHIEKAPHTFLSAAAGGNDPDPAPQDDDPRRPLMRQPWFIFVLLLVVLFIGACVYLFFIWGLPLLLQLIDALQSAGVRIA
jgi:hypothetical protein